MSMWLILLWLACRDNDVQELDLPSPLLKKHCLPLTLTPSSPEAEQWLSPGQYSQLLKRHVDKEKPILDLYCSRWDQFPIQEILEIQPESVIADIGTGTGLLPLKLLSDAIPFQRFYAIDIDSSSIVILKEALQLAFPSEERIVPVLSEPTNIGVPENSVDIMLSINTRIDRFLLTEKGLTHPDTLCASIRLALKPSGILHHFEPSYIDDLGVEKLDLQVREGYLACGIELQAHPPIRINQSDYLHWSGDFAISQ